MLDGKLRPQRLDLLSKCAKGRGETVHCGSELCGLIGRAAVEIGCLHFGKRLAHGTQLGLRIRRQQVVGTEEHCLEAQPGRGVVARRAVFFQCARVERGNQPQSLAVVVECQLHFGGLAAKIGGQSDRGLVGVVGQPGRQLIGRPAECGRERLDLLHRKLRCRESG